MTFRHDLVPNLFSGCAAEVFDNGTSHVEHDVHPQRNVAGPPKRIMNTEGDKKSCPFDENACFQQHDHDAVYDVVVVDILQKLVARIMIG